MAATTLTLPIGQALTVSAVSDSSVRRVGDVAGVLYAPDFISAGGSSVFGPYLDVRQFELIGDPILPTYTLTLGEYDEVEGNAITVDTINEQTSAAGVTIDGVLLKDTTVTALQKQTAMAANGAITIAAGTVLLTKAGVLAATLAAPTSGQAGTRITIISQTAYAHTLTATDLIDDGVTGGAKDLATFEAFAGASITLEAVNLKWAVVALNAVTVSAV